MSASLLREGPEAIYLEIDGERWRVYDCTISKTGSFRRQPTPSSRAKYRVFVSAAGVRRAHQFTWREIRELTALRLEAQFKRAGYLASRPADPDDYGQIGGPVPSGG